MTSRALILIGVVAMTSGCDAGGTEPSGPGGMVCPMPVTPADWDYPAGPYGSANGEVFEDFSLEDCDGNPVSFGEVLGGAELVLFNVGAGWCQPCKAETAQLEPRFHEPYCDDGLRIVQILFQDAQGLPATKFFCRQWRDEYGLTFPVLVDPLFTMESLLSLGQTPLNLLIDRDGVIRYRSVGQEPANLHLVIDQLLLEGS